MELLGLQERFACRAWVEGVEEPEANRQHGDYMGVQILSHSSKSLIPNKYFRSCRISNGEVFLWFYI